MAGSEEITLALDLACFLIRQSGRQIDPGTSMPIACAWSFKNLYGSCLEAIRVVEGLPQMSVDGTARLRVRQRKADHLAALAKPKDGD